MVDVLSASRPRCAAVALGATACALAAMRLLAPLVLEAAPDVDGVLVRGCAIALAGCVIWAWAATLAVVLEAWVGVTHRTPRGVPVALRRLVLAACGLALAGAVSSAATAAEDPGPPPPGSLAGLPLPERAEAPASAADVLARPAPGRAVVVRTGDTLWAIASTELPEGADDAAVSRHWQRIHRANLGVIGPDPDLILPGQRLALPDPRTEANPSEEAP